VTDSIGRDLALVGPGRAGTAVAIACIDAGDRVVAVAGRAPGAESTVDVASRVGAAAVAVEDAGRDADVVIIATPDAAIESAAARLAPGLRAGALVVHLAGARGVDALESIAQLRDDVEVGALHPLQTLPSGEAGRDALRGAWAAVAGPPAVAELAERIGLRAFQVDDADRALYHAAACVASNHLVALLGQVERLAASAAVPYEVFGPLVRSSVDHALALGPARALTGPVARGDAATVAAHLDAIPAEDRAAYRALAAEARRLAPRDDSALDQLLEVPA
jgi:predicted short-subunit dehydrogenase-like oxidoreductase (DUF2520 family)